MGIDDQLVSQVQSLRKLGYYVNDICQQLDLHKSCERAAVQVICNEMPKKFQVGIHSSESPFRRHVGTWA